MRFTTSIMLFAISAPLAIIAAPISPYTISQNVEIKREATAEAMSLAGGGNWSGKREGKTPGGGSWSGRREADAEAEAIPGGSAWGGKTKGGKRDAEAEAEAVAGGRAWGGKTGGT